MENLLLIALARKYRFDSPKGQLNLEQVFDLNDTELDTLYRVYESQIDKTSGLLGKRGNADTKNKLKIVESIFNYKREEAETNAINKDNRELRGKLLETAEVRRMQEITEGKSSEELIKMANKLK